MICKGSVLPKLMHILLKLQNCPIDEILEARSQVTGSIKGSDLVKKLRVSKTIIKNEQTFFNTVLGRYLMDNCAE